MQNSVKKLERKIWEDDEKINHQAFLKYEQKAIELQKQGYKFPTHERTIIAYRDLFKHKK